MAIKYLIVHEAMGIFIGHAMGLTFWSLLENGGQQAVVIWDTEDDARDFVHTRMGAIPKGGFSFPAVDAVNPDFATIQELINSGHAALVGELFKELQPVGTIQ